MNSALGSGSGAARLTTPVELVVLDQEPQRGGEVVVVDPGDVLAPVPGGAAQAAAHEPEQRVEDAAGVGAHHHRRAHRDLARRGRLGLLERSLPRPRDVDAEAPGLRRARLVAAEPAAALVVGRVVGVRVDRRGAGLEPEAGRALRLGDRAAEDARRLHARVGDLAPVGLGVAAVDAAPARLTTTSAPSISANHGPAVRPSQRTPRAARLRITTWAPSRSNARASTVPTWPLPPAMTTFIRAI
jgi:hypothetical protein